MKKREKEEFKKWLCFQFEKETFKLLAGHVKDSNSYQNFSRIFSEKFDFDQLIKIYEKFLKVIRKEYSIPNNSDNRPLLFTHSKDIIVTILSWINIDHGEYAKKVRDSVYIEMITKLNQQLFNGKFDWRNILLANRYTLLMPVDKINP